MQGKLWLIGCVAFSYLLTMGTVGAIAQHGNTSHRSATASLVSKPRTHFNPKPKKPVAITGIPVRVVVPTHAIDLSIEPGEYNPADNSWTLNDTDAFFAKLSNPANNSNGNTFIYGHGTDAVFGKLSANPPTPGTIAKVYTDNGYVFTYTFREVKDYDPADTSALSDISKGKPRVTLQTCTGDWSQWRTMYTFDFQKANRL